MLVSNPLHFLTLESTVYGLPHKRDVDKLSRSINQAASEITFEILHYEAEKLARMVKEEIMSQPGVWPPLNQNYKDWKERMGLNTDMLRATDFYYDHISVQEVRNERGRFISDHQVRQSKSFSIRVGVPYIDHPGLDEEKSDDKPKISLPNLALILEYGTATIPARPHWGPTFARWKAQHARTVRARIMAAALKRYRQIFKKNAQGNKKSRKIT